MKSEHLLSDGGVAKAKLQVHVSKALGLRPGDGVDGAVVLLRMGESKC